MKRSSKLILSVSFLVVATAVTFWLQLPSPDRNNPDLELPMQTPGSITSRFRSLPSPAPSPQPMPIPVQHRISGGQHVFQSFNNCGPASLSMALSLFGQRVSQQEIGQQTRPFQNAQGDNDDKSVTLAELAARAEALGYTTYVRPAGNMGIVERAIAHDLPVITRTWLKPQEDIGHYRVLKGYDQRARTILQDDSLQGKDLTYTYDAFNELWDAFNHEFLILFPAGKAHLAPEILGETLDERRAWELALEQATLASQDAPNDTYAHFNQSVALFHLGRYDEAVKQFERVESDLPSRMLWYQIEPIQAYIANEQPDEALRRIDAILANENRAFSELYFLKARIHHQRGEDTLAAQAEADAQRYNTSDSWRVNVQAE